MFLIKTVPNRCSFATRKWVWRGWVDLHDLKCPAGPSPNPGRAGAQMPRTTYPQFEVGQVVATPAVLDHITYEDVITLLRLHTRGYWNHMDPEDLAANEEAVTDENRVFSIHFVRGKKVWVITEWDRSYTTLLFPHEY
jgi:hypothetical protein